MSHRTIPQGFHQVRDEHLFEQHDHDPYQAKGKFAEPAVCPQCKAVFHEGRWRWGSVPKGAHEVLCPACHRIKDQLPAGLVSLQGAFFQAHRAEIMSMVKHHEQRERQEHPLKRIVAIDEQASSVLVTTTDIHLARDIGKAVQHAYQGSLEYHYNPQEYLLRVHWAH